MTLNVNLLLCHLLYVYCDQTAQARVTRFRYKVSLHLSYLLVKFNDKIGTDSLRILSMISD